MPNKVTAYVSLTFLAGLLASAALFAHAPVLEPAQLKAVVVLAALGLASEVLAHRIASGAVGTISFVPFLAMVYLVPSWPSVAATAIATGLGSMLRGGTGIKNFFNFSLALLASSAAAAVFLGVGGEPLLPLLAVAHGVRWTAFFAVFLGSIAYMILNTVLVSGVIALSENRSLLLTWSSSVQKTIGYDAVASPVVYLLAWLYAIWGTWGAIIFSAPLLVVREVYKTNRQLERVNQELLELMVKAIEARDPYTSGHSRRVAQYSKIIARAVGCSNSEIERIGIAALLHDVGKIHEMYAPILRKPEKLSPAEWAVMQTHPIKSAELVSTVSHLKDVVAPVRHHHENWDGTGYPDGLTGDNIPRGARIVLFADTIDAMTTDRPYRKALSEPQVRSELIKYRGKQFDPEICDKLLSSPMFGLLFAPNSRQATPESTSPTVRAMPDRAAAHT